MTLTLTGGTQNATLQGTTTQTTVSGIASFTNLSVSHFGDGFTLVASSPGLLSQSSVPFDIPAPPEPRDPLGYGCSSAGGAALLSLLPLLLFLRRRSRAVAALLLALTTAAGGARAAGAPKAAPVRKADLEAARDLNKRGLAELANKNYDAALQLFQEARTHVDSPSLLFNIAETQRLAGRTTEALEAYHQYLAKVPDPAKRLDVSNFAALEAQQSAPPAATPAPTPAQAPAVAPQEASVPQQTVPAKSRGAHAPGLSLGVSWDPVGKRVAGEGLLQLRLGTNWEASAGALLAPRPGGRLMMEYFVFEDEDLSAAVGLRALVAPVPGAVFAGGGPVFVFRVNLYGHFDVFASLSAEVFDNSGTVLFSPVVTSGFSGHL